MVLFLTKLAVCFLPVWKDTLINSDQVEYYACLDFVNLKPVNKIDKKPALPYVKVVSDSAGIKQIKLYSRSSRKPYKVLERIKYRNFRAFTSISKFLQCTSIDTLISLPNKLYELRSCYYGKAINSQDYLYYEWVGRDSIKLKMICLDDLKRDTAAVLRPDTSLNVFDTPDDKYTGYKDDYLIYLDGTGMRVKYLTHNTTRSKFGLDEKYRYDYNGCLYWSMIQHRHWQTLNK